MNSLNAFILTSIAVSLSCGTYANYLPTFINPPELINSTLSTIAIQLQDSIAGSIEPKTFQIQYKRSNGKTWKNVTKPQMLELPVVINIENFSVETVYLLRAVLYTATNESYQKDDVPYTQATTVCQNITDTKLIQGIKVEYSTNHIVINWIPVCKATFQITIKCVADPWCPKDIFVENYKSTKGSITYLNGIIIPYTNYTIELKVLNSTESVTRNIRTLATAPPSVRNMAIYSQDEHYIAVRWQRPYPPYGLLQHYRLIYQICDDEYDSSVIIRNPEPCELWDDYICHTITNLMKDSCYIVKVSAMNTVGFPTSSNDFKVNTTQAMSEPPINLTATWNDEDQLTLTWNHPDITRGQLVGFYINITQIDSEIVRKNVYVVTPRYYAISKEDRSYSYTLDEILPLSTTYQIFVQGANKHVGHNISIVVEAPPLKPALESHPVLGKRTKTMQKIRIPPMESKTLSHTGSVYVVVCDPSTAQDELNPIENNTILKMISCEGKSWVTLEMPANAFEIKTFIGDENVAYSKTLQQTLHNAALDAGSSYMISIVLMNEYKSKTRYNVYTLNASSYSNPAVYAWLLLLLLPPIGWFVYRYIQKGRAENNASTVDPNVRNSMYNPNVQQPTVRLTAEQKLLDQVEKEFFEQ